MSSGFSRPRNLRPVALFTSNERAFQAIPRRDRASAAELSARAVRLGEAAFGPVPAGLHIGVAQAGFGLFAHHTCFVEGAAAFLCLTGGASAAIERREAGPTGAVGGEPSVQVAWTGMPDGTAPLWARVAATVQEVMTGREEPFRLSLVTTVPPSCVEPYVASVAVAVANAWLSASGRRGEGLPYGRLSLAISHLIRGPYSPAYLMAADAEVTDAAMIVNTLTGERRELPVADDTSVCWSLVDAGTEPWQGAGAYEAFADLAREALLILRNGPYPDLRSLATLDFKELNKALGRLPKRFRPVVRFLVGESHRTQHVETALRREDWHVVGGLLFFSHASFRTEWAATNAEVDYVVSEVEASGGEGMYGACLTGRSGCVLVVGERHATPACLGRMRDGFEERFHRTPRFLLL